MIQATGLRSSSSHDVINDIVVILVVVIIVNTLLLKPSQPTKHQDQNGVDKDKKQTHSFSRVFITAVCFLCHNHYHRPGH